MIHPSRSGLACAVLALALLQGCGESGGTGSDNNLNDGPQDAAFLLTPASGGDATFTSEHFSGSANCAQCHDNLTDKQGADVSLVRDWSASLMANAARDPYWKAKVRSELTRNPGLADLINDKCTRCHAPMANVEAKKHGESLALFDAGLLSPENPRHDEAMDGVSCTLCHQIEPTLTADGPAPISGEFNIASYPIASQRKIYGPYTGLVSDPMLNAVAYTPVYSPHIKASELCATCHNLKTAFVDEYGNLLSNSSAEEFPEQMPYSEWEHSDFATQQSCQDCHMSRTDGVIMSTRPPWLSSQRNNFAEHDFIGANALMLDILDQNREQLGVLATGFAENIAKTEAMLRGAASLAVDNASLAGGVLAFTLSIASQTGHKLPSSYPSRRIILHVRVTDATGKTLFESGRIDDNGRIHGVDDDQQRFEPHHTLISRDDQVQVYEAIMGNNHNEVTYTLLRASHYLKDNRLLPRGFDKFAVPDDIKVVGDALTDPDFTGGSDQVHFELSAAGDGPLTVEAELLYQPIAYPFLRDLLTDNNSEASDFVRMYQASPYKSTPMTSLVFNVN